MKVSLLITTYNRSDALHLVLSTVARQSRLPDEVIICDDGSDERTSAVIFGWLRRLPIRHVWSPDTNFRAALTRNLGILKSKSDILIFVDGDCLLPPSFVESHLRLSRPGYLLGGGRLLLDCEKTDLILRRGISLTSVFNHWKFARVPLGPIRDLKSKDWEQVRTCNLSVRKSDVLNIGGFDSSYVGWGREDSDFVVRLLHSGVKIRSARLAACVAHLHHPESPREKIAENEERFLLTLNDPRQKMSKESIVCS